MDPDKRPPIPSSRPKIVIVDRAIKTRSLLILAPESVGSKGLCYFLEQARDHYESQPLCDRLSLEQEHSEDESDMSVLRVNTIGTTATGWMLSMPSLILELWVSGDKVCVSVSRESRLCAIW